MQYFKARIFALGLILVSIGLIYFNWHQLLQEGRYSLKVFPPDWVRDLCRRCHGTHKSMVSLKSVTQIARERFNPQITPITQIAQTQESGAGSKRHLFPVPCFLVFFVAVICSLWIAMEGDR